MRRISLFLGLVTIFAVTLPQIVHAQAEPEAVRVQWSVDDAPEGGWTVGDRIPLQLAATYPADLEITLPELPEEWGPFEVLAQTLLPPADNKDGTLTAIRQAMVTTWAPGDYPTPPFTVRYRDAKDQLHETPVPPLSITVTSVLGQDDTQKRDLKPQVPLPRPPVWPWILGGLLLAALIGVAGWILLTRLLRRTARASIPALTFDPRPPHEIAYGELDRIAALKLPAHGELKHHYTLIADCMRAYAQGRYGIPALDQTTQELVAAFRQARVNRDHASLFRDLLAEADLVKFAKFRPPINRAYAAVSEARHIVDVTRPTEQPTDQQLGGATGPGTQYDGPRSGRLPNGGAPAQRVPHAKHKT
jgi:hypothetical protein